MSVDKKIIPFKPEHLMEFDSAIFEFFPDLEKRGRLYSENGPAYSAVINGKIWGCAGVILLWPGVGEAWAISILNAPQTFPIFFHKAVIQMLNRIIKLHELHRVQAAVRCDWEQAQKWIERIGFEREGLMRQYLPDHADCWRYAKVV